PAKEPSAQPLAQYRAKRDFGETPEPAAAEELVAGERQGPLTFMVHKHAATRLHYDLRLELEGVLLSWAIPKGPSTDPKQRHLAVHVEDHPLEYGGFEGVIPKGQYGGGPSMIWDAGTFSPDEGGPTYFDDRAAAERELRHELNSGKISVTLRGKKLKGSWALIHTKPATNEWLIIKHRDDAARAEPQVTTLGRSVASDLDIDQLRALAETDPELHERSYSPAFLAGSREVPLRFVQPMLATAAPVPARHDGWSFEPKLDGIRVLASVDHGRASLRSRGGHDITTGYPAIASALSRQPVATCLFDGEIVAIAANGRPSFELLQQRMNLQGAEQIAAAERDIPVVYYVFDILHLDGYELCGLSLADRREVLARVVIPSARVSEVVTIHAPPAEAFSIAVSAGFEGMVAKRDSSRYEAGRRSPAWLKRKALDRDTFVVGGYTAGLGSRGSSFGGLLIGQPGEGGLSYCGRVGGGFTG